MPRVSAFRGTWQPNRRPYVVLTPDAYVSLQGSTSVIACGECRRELNVNKYLTGISTEGSVDSPPGSATVNLSIPDNDINEFYVDNNLVIIPMMEIELFAKGYFTVGGVPQYYRIFWGMVSSVQKSWSNGVTTVTLNCKDILRWWELTNVITQSAFLEAGKSQSGWNLFQNKFAGANPYTVIITLAKEAMGDFSLTTGSFTSFQPETGPEQGVISQYAKDIMAYWQLKFGNIWNNLVLYGTSGQAYTFAGEPGNVSPVKIARQIFEAEEAALNLNPETALFKIQPHEIAAVKVDLPRAGDVDFFQNETQSKLSMALTARDQAGAYEFYCDSTGDIVFKPPFYNLNVMPNKPVSWIQDYEVLDDTITDDETGVVTHITSSGNAFGGVTDFGLNDDITTPRTGVIDWHLLKRYGWRRIDVQLEWAGNPKKLFYHLLDHIDKVNARRIHGSVTIPLRPELRMGFPVWFPKYDSFFYVSSISHNYSPGGQATTQLQLIARRQKFVAPKNIGIIKTEKSRTTTYTDPNSKQKFTQTRDTYAISFPSDVGSTSGLTSTGQDAQYGGPAVLRHPKTGKLLGFPNAVMVYRTTLSGTKLTEILQKSGNKKGHNPTKQDKKSAEGSNWQYTRTIGDVFISLQNERRAEVVDRLRLHRYEAGMTNAGTYDYAHDSTGTFKEFSVIPTDSITWGAGTDDPNAGVSGSGGLKAGAQSVESKKEKDAILKKEVAGLEFELLDLQSTFIDAKNAFDKIYKEFRAFKKSRPNPKDNELDEETKQRQELVNQAKAARDSAAKAVTDAKAVIGFTKSNQGRIRALQALNVMVRPVSDEFGFEVIGHYRYGRGAFIDRGQLQIPATPSEVTDNKNFVNQLNVQFAAHGGLLTDPSAQNANNLGPESPNFAEAYEKMQPDDYMTGATFKGANYSSDQFLEQVNPTGQNTYTSSLKSASEKGTAVFAEADSLRRAITLAELKPTTINGLDEAVSEKCGCELGRTDWITVLPQTFINEILGPFGSVVTGAKNGQSVSVNVDGQSTTLPPDGVIGPNGDVSLQPVPLDENDPLRAFGETTAGLGFFDDSGNLLSGFIKKDDGSIVAGTGQVIFSPNITVIPNGDDFKLSGTGGFFDILRQFLIERFDRDYQENKVREEFAIGGSTPRFAPDLDEQNNIVPTPSPKNSLFDRASMGDPDALRAMAQGANFNFGQSEQALKDFKDTVNDVTDIRTVAEGRSFTSGEEPQWQPPVGQIVFPSILNPTDFPLLGSGTGEAEPDDGSFGFISPEGAVPNENT